MAELLRLTPLFPGTDYMDQLRRIINILGTPTEQELNELCLEGKCLQQSLLLMWSLLWTMESSFQRHVSSFSMKWVMFHRPIFILCFQHCQNKVMGFPSLWKLFWFYWTFFDNLGIDFIQRLLRFDPRQRPSAEEALGRFSCANIFVNFHRRNSFSTSIFIYLSWSWSRADCTSHSKSSWWWWIFSWTMERWVKHVSVV